MDIEINCSSVANYGQQIIEYAVDFESAVSHFCELIDQINTFWEGQDALKYINVMKEKYVVGLEAMGDVLDKYGEYLKKVPDTYQSLDEAFASKSISV